MKVTITEVTDLRDAVLASGLALWIERMGVPVEAPAQQLPLTMQPVVEESPARQPESAPIKRKYAKKVVETAGPKATAAAPAEKPRLTIRQRILDFLDSGRKTPKELALLLKRAGLPDSIDVSQHLYLMKRDGRVDIDNDGFYGRAA